MQLYKVNFLAQKGDVVETGTYLVCAKDTADAEAMVATTANAPIALTTFETKRVKPSIYELSRSDFRLSDIAASVGRGEGETGAVHEIRASAKVYGYSEHSVLRRFANAIIEGASAANAVLPKHVNELNVEIERADYRPRPSRIEEQSIYREKRFFAGGAVRPR